MNLSLLSLHWELSVGFLSEQSPSNALDYVVAYQSWCFAAAVCVKTVCQTGFLLAHDHGRATVQIMSQRFSTVHSIARFHNSDQIHIFSHTMTIRTVSLIQIVKALSRLFFLTWQAFLSHVPWKGLYWSTAPSCGQEWLLLFIKSLLSQMRHHGYFSIVFLFTLQITEIRSTYRYSYTQHLN